MLLWFSVCIYWCLVHRPKFGWWQGDKLEWKSAKFCFLINESIGMICKQEREGPAHRLHWAIKNFDGTFISRIWRFRDDKNFYDIFWKKQQLERKKLLLGIFQTFLKIALFSSEMNFEKTFLDVSLSYRTFGFDISIYPIFFNFLFFSKSFVEGKKTNAF